MMKKGIFRFAAAVAAVLTAAAVVWAAPLSKKRATAVLMYDIDSSNRYSSATVWDYYGGVSVSRGGASRSPANSTTLIIAVLPRGLGFCARSFFRRVGSVMGVRS